MGLQVLRTVRTEPVTKILLAQDDNFTGNEGGHADVSARKILPGHVNQIPEDRRATLSAM